MTDHYNKQNFVARNCLGYLISQAQATMRPQVEALFETEDISFSQWRVLMCLREGRGNTCAEVSRELFHDKGSMTRLIDQLEERGLLTRERDPGDRRVVFLALTKSGRAAGDALARKVVAYHNELLAPFPAQDVKQFIGLLTKLTDALRRREDSAPAASRQGARAS